MLRPSAPHTRAAGAILVAVCHALWRVVPSRNSYELVRGLGSGTAVLVALLLSAISPSPAEAFRERVQEIVVTKIIDGDSLVASAGKRRIEVRLADIDAPEGRQAYGRAARDAAARLALGQRGHMRTRARDGYGRIVADVYLADGRNLGHLLVAAGFAWHDARFRDKPELAALEESARRARRGLWAAPRPEPPWDYRRRHPRPRK